MNRNIVVGGTVDIKDDEIFEDERCNYSVSGNATVGESQPSGLVSFSRGCGGEVRVEIELNAQALSNGEVKIVGTAKLFEGISENTTDLEDERSIDILLPVNSLTPFNLRLVNRGTGGGDTADIRLNFANFPA